MFLKFFGGAAAGWPLAAGAQQPAFGGPQGPRNGNYKHHRYTARGDCLSSVAECGGCLALTNFTKEKPSDTAGGTIAFEVEDLDRLITDLRVDLR
jgi:hypothetical protein